MTLPLSSDPPPADPIKPSRAATLLHVRPRAVYRRIERGQLRAWRDVDSGRLVVSEAEVRGKLRQVRPPEPPEPAPRPAPMTLRERQKLEAEAEARRRFRLPVQ